METEKLKLFEKQLNEAVAQFPNLKIVQDETSSYLKGVLDVCGDDGSVAGSFLVEVRYKKGFPNRFPHLLEVGGMIPNEIDWHKYPDSRCCITVLADEIIECRNEISVTSFIKKHATAFLANFVYRQLTGAYKNGEYAHGVPGVKQFYINLLGTDNYNVWIKYYKHSFQNLRIEIGRNDNCFCGSNIKYKNCHLRVFDKLRIIGKNRVKEDFELILKQ